MMKKMTFNLFSRLILWFRKTFCIHPKTKYTEKKLPAKFLSKKKPIEVSQTPKEKSAKVALAEEKPIEEEPAEKEKSKEEIHAEEETPKEEKPPEQEKLTEEKPSKEKEPSEEEEPKEEKISTTEPSQKLDEYTKDLKTKEKIEKELQMEYPEEEKAKTETGKPYKRKTLTEEGKKEGRRPSENEKKPVTLKRRGKIDLGSIKRKKLRSTKQPAKLSIERTDNASEEKETSARIESPFIEIDLDEAKVFLIIPKQQFKSDIMTNISRQLDYKLELNGEEQSISAKVSNDDQGTAKVEEKRIELERPLKNFQVLFSDELQGRTYSYNHNDENLYAFAAIGNNRGRMYYLYDKDGNINPLPNRMVWLLLHEDSKLEIESNYLTEETWIWEKYRPFRVNLKEMNELAIKNTKTSKEYKLSCEATFSIEGQVIEDDFKNQMPLLMGETLKIKAPRENPYGWTVWIQNKIAGYRIITENWSGVEPLSLKLPDDLPCECGEFQVDICQQDTRIPDETLFFRWLSFIELNYPKELIIPNPRQGHKSEFIKVKVSGEGWALNYGLDRKVGPVESNSCQIELRPEENTVRFSITKKGKPETLIRFQITIPRLKWKTSKHEGWNGKLRNIKRDELIYGESFYLLICTNDFNNKYDLSAILETNGQRIQEGKFIQQGINYGLELNQFYDTIKRNKSEIMLKARIRKEEHDYLIDETYILKIIPPIIRCKIYPRSFETHRIEDMMSHFKKCHLPDFIEHITYEEIREYDKSLPHKIYKCHYCPFYSREDDPQNCTDVICNHIENVHDKRICFRIVSTIDEIRQNVFPNLPFIYKCKLCRIHFINFSKKEQVEHFFEKHKNEICEYSEM